MRTRATLIATATLSLALTLTACAQSLPVWENHDNPVPNVCRDAYAAAVIVHARNQQSSDFDLAITKCIFYADWKGAVATDPTAIGVDAMEFLASRCGDAEPLASAVICISVNR